jgi:hypothetical protein
VRFNAPPGWPQPPANWTPPQDWRPDPNWPALPSGWQLWLPEEIESTPVPDDVLLPVFASVAAQVTLTPDDGSVPRPAGAGPQIGPVSDHRDDSGNLRDRIAELEAALARARGEADPSVIDLDDQRVLQDVGIYRYHHPLESAAAYKDRLESLESEMDVVIKSGRAVLAADMFTFSGSLAKGRKMVADLSKLMLRAYNAEADNCVR